MSKWNYILYYVQYFPSSGIMCYNTNLCNSDQSCEEMMAVWNRIIRETLRVVYCTVGKSYVLSYMLYSRVCGTRGELVMETSKTDLKLHVRSTKLIVNNVRDHVSPSSNCSRLVINLCRYVLWMFPLYGLQAI